MASIIEAFKQTAASPANNNNDKLAAILLWDAGGLKQSVADLVFYTWVGEDYSLGAINDKLHERMSSAFGLYRQWLWLESILGDALYKQDLSDNSLISHATKEVIDREVNSEYYFDDADYMATVYDSFVADIQEAYELYMQDHHSPAGPDLIAATVERNFYQLLLNPWLYVKYGWYIDKQHYDFPVDVNKVGPDDHAISVPTPVPVGTILTGKRRGLFY